MTDQTNDSGNQAGSPQEAQEFLSSFSEKLNLFMEQVVHMHNRLNELEIAIAYLLSKDPEWVENFKKQQSEQPSGGNSEQQEKLVEPE